MRGAVLGIVLAVALQATPAPTVAVVQGERVEIVTLEAAQQEHDRLAASKVLTATQRARLVALGITLGTVPCYVVERDGKVDAACEAQRFAKQIHDPTPD